MDIAGKNFLVIGGSGVLGQEMVNQLAASGANVLATTHSQSTSIDNATHGVVELDLANSSSISSAATAVAQKISALDGIVNCAGLVGFATIADTTPEQAARLMQVNHLGPAALITFLLPQLLGACESNGEALVVGITGVVAERSFPGLSAYGESKLAASRHLAALAQEHRRVKLDARPGHTETGLAQRAAFGVAPAFPEGMSAKHVVATIISGIQTGKSELASTDF
jgi:cyclic-di-GMP-binding biofilm dispersal mediator protein